MSEFKKRCVGGEIWWDGLKRPMKGSRAKGFQPFRFFISGEAKDFYNAFGKCLGLFLRALFGFHTSRKGC